MAMSLDSRPLTPDSQLASSLHRATTTIDELTNALTNASRLSSPEPENVCTCCCGREECENSKAWATLKAKLESRLVLSAEVGRALLERHEALVRRQGQQRHTDDSGDTVSSDSSVDVRVAELVKQNAVLEKRLAQALMHTEMSETSKKALLQELEEARTDVARLSSQNARAVGLENRLAMALQEKDDLKQELDSSTQRVRMTETRIISYREKCAKLQAQVTRLREDLESQRVHRHELSEEILSDARQRLEQLQHYQLGHAADIQDTEVTKVLETLVADNEALKRDNAELQNLLAAEREELHSLQEELEERRASDTPFRRGHRFTHSGTSFTYHDTSAPLSPTFQVGTAPTGSALRSRLQSEKAAADRRSLSAERSRERTSRRPFEPLTPETDRRPLSPTDSHIAAGSKWTSFAHPRTVYAPSQLSAEVDDPDNTFLSSERPRAQKPLFLLTRDRGVQTDISWHPGAGVLSSSPIPPRTFGDHVSSHDGQSESSSLTDGIHSTAIGTVVERTAHLLNRMTQADALTLTNRLKRQHLLGADVSHLSRTTVNAILNDANALRGHFRPFLEDEKTVTTCTRRDLRSLLKLVKDVFTELGQMRVTLNDVILDPTVAGKVSEMALNPSKAQASEGAARDSPSGPSGSSWIAPISKLLGLPGSGNNPTESAASRALSPPARNIGRGRPPRIAPKLQPALSASAMTVNVEFSGAAVGRAVTSTYSAHPGRTSGFPSALNTPSTALSTDTPVIAQPAPRQEFSKSVMDIFAGAPKPAEGDPWIVVGRPPSGARLNRNTSLSGMSKASAAATIGRASLRHSTPGKRLSRIVDAVIDSPQLGGGEGADPGSDQSDGPPPALERALRRGLSDSSIHTTFTQHGDEPHPEPGPSQPADRESVLQALSRKMQSFRFTSATPAPARAGSLSRPQTPTGRPESKSREDPDTPKRSPPRPIPRAQQPPRSTTLFGLSSWAAALEEDEDDAHDGVPTPYYAGSPREEDFIRRDWPRKRDL
ncbi:hypothetical protein L226DRAFT_476686 [Lentinus tigrinus ALCF2SS1-7]|uniref:Uncharacterized protein n=1 Tax=Lentinus tigrinus ALCF2SS1-6 TaxID=1328759 RepID=A0A5C2SSE3_9APHY|nr:hypothetical protein L227DRAFT_537481 [Lentinus tigrinus ALCF2SS1-6]RPD80739.1 hypothetical protein L226DRAFT_476686 [Lentinus tigrinus ALCF2SS1-7]